jgi:hypothetical protein
LRARLLTFCRIRFFADGKLANCQILFYSLVSGQGLTFLLPGLRLAKKLSAFAEARERLCILPLRKEKGKGD